MSDAIYAPPKADVAVPVEEAAELYVVARWKFYLLGVLTMNLYLAYWFYRNWRAVKRREGSDIWPVARAIFHVFFTHSLFREIDKVLRQEQAGYHWKPMLFATLYVLQLIASGVTTQVSARGIGFPYIDMAWWVLALVAPLLLLPAQTAINIASADPMGGRNARLTLANWLWLTFGSLIWIMSVVGTYMMLVQPELFVE